MKPLVKIIFLLILLAGSLTYSCRKIDEYPPEPWIRFTGFELMLNATDSIYDRGILKFEFTDGDGDLGLAKADTFPPYNFGSRYYYNLLIDFYEVRNGVETYVPLTYYDPVSQGYDTVYQHARIPQLIPKNVVKSISGDIYDTLFIYNYNSPYDTLFFKFYIVDRALHESNIEVTPYIVRVP